MQASPLKRFFHDLLKPLDGWLMSLLFALFIVSMVALYSASNQSWEKIDNKLFYSALSLVVMWILARLSPQMVMHMAVPLYIAGVVMLAGVEVAGITVNGSTRWLNLGITRIQPSEIMKIGVPMMVAWYFHKYEMVLNWRHYIVASVLIVIPGILVLKQPDLGTAILVMGGGLFAMYFAGLSWKIIIGGIVALLASLPVIWEMMHDYQRRRVLTLIDPTQDPLGDGYHIIQSMIAIGSGGFWGKGWLNGSQTHLDYIPERTTDFIFAVYSEEFGLMGNLLLLAIYLGILSRCLIITARAPTMYGRLLAGSITLSFFVYVFVNMGMVAGILPVVGVPLPFMSYGGTATLSLGIALGLLMGIANMTKR